MMLNNITNLSRIVLFELIELFNKTNLEIFIININLKKYK